MYRYKAVVQLAVKLNKQENFRRRKTKERSWEKTAIASLHGDDLTSSEEESSQYQARENKSFLREGKERLRALIASIDRFESSERYYREGLESVSSYLTVGARYKLLSVNDYSTPYIPLIREKHKIRNIL